MDDGDFWLISERPISQSCGYYVDAERGDYDGTGAIATAPFSPPIHPVGSTSTILLGIASIKWWAAMSTWRSRRTASSSIC